MELENIKRNTTWNDASESINSNFSKIRQELLLLGNKEGLTEAQLEEYLTSKGYTKEEWVLAQNALLEERIENLEQGGGGGSANIEGSAFISVSQDGVISLDVDPQGGLGRTEQGLGIVNIPSAASQELKDYADTAAHAAYEQAYDDAVRAATSYAEKMPLKTINGQSVRGEGDITIAGTKGDKGDAGVTSAEVSVDNKSGLPSATASVENQVLKINFSGLKGEQGNSGFTGAADELEVVNNLTQGGAAAALSAEMGKQIGDVLFGKSESGEGDEGGEVSGNALTSADFMQGSISVDGSFANSATRIRTDKIEVKTGDKWQVIADESQNWAYELYNANGAGNYNSGWITNSRIVEITEDGFIGFVIRESNNANIQPSELLVTIRKSNAVITKHFTENAITSENYDVVTTSGGDIRGRLLIDALKFLDYRLDLSVASDSTIKVAVQLKNSLAWASSVFDAGWKTAGATANITKSNGVSARYITLNFLYSSSNSNQPSIEDIKKYITFDLAYDIDDDGSGDDAEPSEPAVDRGLIGKVDDLSASVSEVEKNLEDMEEEIEDLQQQVAEGVGVVNNLTDGGADKALSAEMGKQIGDDIYGVPEEYEYTQDDIVEADYRNYQGKRSYVQFEVEGYADWQIEVSVPSTSSIKAAIQGSATSAYGSQIDDSGWVNPSLAKTYSRTLANPSVKYVRVVFTDTATASIAPTIEELIVSGVKFSMKATISEGGLFNRVEKIEDELFIPDGAISYKGEKVNLKYYGFKFEVFNIRLSSGISSRQGSAIWGNHLFQFHNTLETIVAYNLKTKVNEQVISLAAIPNCHAGSGGFGNEYYDASDPFPLLYISSMDEMKIYVFRITGVEGAWSITLVQTITIDLDVLKIPNITIDRESNKIVFFGYTKASWNTAAGNQSVITSCDIPLLSDGDVTITDFYNVSRLPFIYAQQGAFARLGKLYLSWGNTAVAQGGGAYVIDYWGGAILTSINFSSVGVFEPEGFSQYGDEIIMTDQNGKVYRLSF